MRVFHYDPLFKTKDILINKFKMVAMYVETQHKLGFYVYFQFFLKWTEYFSCCVSKIRFSEISLPQSTIVLTSNHKMFQNISVL